MACNLELFAIAIKHFFGMGHRALFSLMTGLALVRHLVYSDGKKYQSLVVTILH